MRYLIISDLHGKNKITKKLKSIIETHNIDGINTKLIVNGDCIDGGKEGFKLLTLIKDLQERDIAIMTRGNHERFFLDWLSNKGDIWEFNDYNDYGLKWLVKDTCFESHSDYYAYKPYLKNIISNKHQELITWLEKLPNYIELNHFIIVHAGVNFNNNNPEGWKETPEREMESMDSRALNTNNSGKWIVTGHMWTHLFHNNNDIYVNDKNKSIHIDGDILNGGQLNMLEIDDELNKIVVHNNI